MVSSGGRRIRVGHDISTISASLAAEQSIIRRLMDYSEHVKSSL